MWHRMLKHENEIIPEEVFLRFLFFADTASIVSLISSSSVTLWIFAKLVPASFFFFQKIIVINIWHRLRNKIGNIRFLYWVEPILTYWLLRWEMSLFTNSFQTLFLFYVGLGFLPIHSLMPNTIELDVWIKWQVARIDRLQYQIKFLYWV